MEQEPPPAKVYRHALFTRIWHWVNAVAVIVLIGSGLTISNAHKYLYWGQAGSYPGDAWLALPRFPGWMTIPTSYSLSGARIWHLFFALVLAFGLLAYIVWSLVSRHIQRDLRVRREDVSAKHLIEDARAHAQLRFHDPANPKAYNSFQKLSYISLLFVLLPLLIVSGLALSPGMDAAWPWLTDMFGGRQSARSVHFIAMVGVVAFTIVHLAAVLLAGPWNEVRSMITGWWRVPE